MGEVKEKKIARYEIDVEERTVTVSVENSDPNDWGRVYFYQLEGEGVEDIIRRGSTTYTHARRRSWHVVPLHRRIAFLIARDELIERGLING